MRCSEALASRSAAYGRPRSNVGCAPQNRAIWGRIYECRFRYVGRHMRP
jgi:hypothetical protein